VLYILIFWIFEFFYLDHWTLDSFSLWRTLRNLILYICIFCVHEFFNLDPLDPPYGPWISCNFVICSKIIPCLTFWIQNAWPQVWQCISPSSGPTGLEELKKKKKNRKKTEKYRTLRT
jgi:hypothetical protein